MKTDLVQIEEAAHRVRNRMFPDGDTQDSCLVASKELAQELSNLGYKVSVYQGNYHLDWPDQNKYCDIDWGRLSDRQIAYCIYNPLHYWPQVGKYIIDITADQFNGEIEEFDRVGNVVIGTRKELFRYIRPKRWITF